MPTLEIAVDARGVPQGLEQANRALDQTAKKADRAEKEVKDLGHSAHTAGRDMSAAFAATGGGLAITHGLEGMTSGLRSGNSAMAAFAASQALLDLGRFAEDMKSVNAATGTATTMFGRLGVIIRAHPLMAIATVLAGAAAAMAIFADDTEDAADAFTKLGENMEKARMSQAARQLLGLGIAPQLQQRQQAVIGLAEQMTGPAMPSYEEMARALGDGYTPKRLQEMGRELLGPAHPMARIQSQDVSVAEREALLRGQNLVTREIGRAILRSIYTNLQTEIEQQAAQRAPGQAGVRGLMGPTLPPGFSQYADPSLQPLMRDRAAAATPAPLGPTLPPGFQQFADPRLLPTLGNFQGTYTGGQPEALTGGIGMPFGTGFGIQFGMQAGAQMQAYAQEQAVLAQQRMDELIAQGQEFGQTIGDAFFRVAEGTMTARQAMAELVRMFAQMGAQSVFRQIGGAIGGAFGETQTQTTADNNASE